MIDIQLELDFALACQAGDTATVISMTTSRGINTEFKSGQTFLLKAVTAGNIDIVSLLIDQGANVNYQDSLGNTALSYASRENIIEIVSLLINKGAKVDMQDNSGNTPLSLALTYNYRCNMEVAEFLIKNGANINNQDKNGYTPLINAVIQKKQENVNLLMDKGANISIVNNNGVTAYDIAALNKFYYLMVLINPHMMSQPDKNGLTILMKACIKGDVELLLVLIEKASSGCADFHLENNKGDSAYKILNRKNNLSPALKAIKEKLILGHDIEEDNTLSRGL